MKPRALRPRSEIRPPRRRRRRDHGRDRDLGPRHHLRGGGPHVGQEARRVRGDLPRPLLRGDRGRRRPQPRGSRRRRHQARRLPPRLAQRRQARRREAPRTGDSPHRLRAQETPGGQLMEREPLTPETEALWRRLWEIWQDNDEEDVVLDSLILDELEDEIPELILFDVYEPR